MFGFVVCTIRQEGQNGVQAGRFKCLEQFNSPHLQAIGTASVPA